MLFNVKKIRIFNISRTKKNQIEILSTLTATRQNRQKEIWSVPFLNNQTFNRQPLWKINVLSYTEKACTRTYRKDHTVLQLGINCWNRLILVTRWNELARWLKISNYLTRIFHLLHQPKLTNIRRFLICNTYLNSDNSH